MDAHLLDDSAQAPPRQQQRQRRKKTAGERRAQQLRSEARMAQRLVKGLVDIQLHRGGALSSVGKAILDALRNADYDPPATQPPSTTAPGPMDDSPRQASASHPAPSSASSSVETVLGASAAGMGSGRGTRREPRSQQQQQLQQKQQLQQQRKRQRSPTATGTAQESSHYAAGQTVRLVGLTLETELNGRLGEVLHYDVAADRVVVRVGQRVHPVRVRPGNLELGEDLAAAG